MIKINKDNKIEIVDVTPVYQNEEISYFSTVISIKEIGEVYNKLTYDSTAQRGSIHTAEGDFPLVDIQHIKQIKESILNGGKIRGNLTWNVRVSEELMDDDIEYFSYDSNKKSLIINGNTITLPDSAHRHFALYQISQEEKDDDLLNYQFGLDIYNMTLDEEKEFFTDINGKGKSVNKNRILYLSNDIKSLLLKDVINESSLIDKIEFEKNNTPVNKLCKFSTLYESLFGITGSYKLINIDKDNYEEYKKWFVRFYNELYESREEFYNISVEGYKTENKKNSILLEELSWWAYAYICKKIQSQDKWKRILKNKLNKKNNVQGISSPIDYWSKANPVWACIRNQARNPETGDIELTSVINSNTTRKKIQNIIALDLFS